MYEKNYNNNNIFIVTIRCTRFSRHLVFTCFVLTLLNTRTFKTITLRSTAWTRDISRAGSLTGLQHLNVLNTG